MFKKGDKVVCIKTRTIGIIVETEKIYTITHVGKYNIQVGDYTYSIIKKDSHYSFDDYFISLKEYRKQKLKKLCTK